MLSHDREVHQSLLCNAQHCTARCNGIVGVYAAAVQAAPQPGLLKEALSKGSATEQVIAMLSVITLPWSEHYEFKVQPWRPFIVRIIIH
jgi:hypothetical protein